MNGTFGLRRIAPGAVGLVCALTLAPNIGTLTATACPAPPSFSEYITDATGIVVATVRDTKVETRTSEDEEYQVSYATLEVVQSVKGPFTNYQQVTVAGFPTGRDAAAGPSEVIVFIGTPEGDGDPVAVQTIDVADRWERDSLIMSIKEFLATLDIEDSLVRARAQREWTIRCVENEPTREWGLRELAESGFSYVPDDDGDATATDTIDPSQIERLVTVLESIDDPGTAFYLISYLSKFDDPRVVDQIRVWLSRSNADADDDAGWLMQFAAEQLNWTTGQWLASRYYETEDAKTKLEIVAQFQDLSLRLDELPEALDAAAKAEAEAMAYAEQERLREFEPQPDAEVFEDQVTVDERQTIVSIDELQDYPATEVESPNE